MVAKQTVAVYIRVDLVEEVKRRKLNMSQLVNTLLEQYLFGTSNDVSEYSIRISNIEKRITEIFEKVNEVEELKRELEKLKLELREKEEKKKEEKYEPLIKKLREQVFDDLEDLLNNRRVNPAHAIKVRLSVFASENNISLPEAKQLFFKAFPEYNGHLKSVLEGELRWKR